MIPVVNMKKYPNNYYLDKEKRMQYSPVMIITLNRFEHLKKCIESLKKNKGALETEVYIGVDYPPNEKYRLGYLKIKDFLNQGIEGFSNVKVFYRAENEGWYNNYAKLRDEIYKKYDRFIYTEDDNVFSINFLEYVNQGLEYYENDITIQGICGYSYPVEWKTGGNVVKINSYFAGWGFGIWKEKEREMEKNITMEYFEKIFYDKKTMYHLYKTSQNQFCNFVKGMVEYIPNLIKEGKIVKIDLSFGIYIFSVGKYMIFPYESKVRNIGYDGSGMNCSVIKKDSTKKVDFRNYDYGMQEIDDAEVFDLQEKELQENEKYNNDRLNEFFKIGSIEKFKTLLIYIMCLFFGRKKINKMLKKIR